MPTSNRGEFSFIISHEELARGLRPSKRAPRNAKYLVQCDGAVGLDGVLQTLEDLNTNLVNTAIIGDGFPYPQLFLFKECIVICGEQNIYEYAGGALVFKLAVPSGIRWSGVDFGDFVYMSNGKVAVRRRASDQTWSQTTDYPIASGICDYNGQVLIISPNVERV